MASKLWRPLIVQPTRVHTATAIILHGSGSNALDVHEWFQMKIQNNFNFHHIKLMYPNAPERPYTPAMGKPSTVWFDRAQISPFAPEDTESIQESCDLLRQIVEEEISAGIPPERIIVGGFSMGGALALYYGMRCGLNLAGIFALSSFLNENSIVYEDFEENPGLRPPLFQAHGQRDPLVNYNWGLATNKKLKELGVKTEFHTFPDLFHEIGRKETIMLSAWMNLRLPES